MMKTLMPLTTSRYQNKHRRTPLYITTDVVCAKSSTFTNKVLKGLKQLRDSEFPLCAGLAVLEMRVCDHKHLGMISDFMH